MKSIFQFLNRGINSSLTVYKNAIRTKFGKIKNLQQKLVKKVKKIVQGAIGFVFGKPNSVKDYTHWNEWYVSKRFLIKLLVILVVIVFISVRFIFPYLNGRLWPAHLVINTQQYYDFTGKGKVYNDDEQIIYTGSLTEGVVEGEGELYKNGNLVYKGEFSNNKYNGNGVLYDGKDVLYKGAFSDNLYNGDGVLYFDNSNEAFKGVFENGKYLNGTEYYRNGKKKYSGGYENGQYNGSATMFDPEVDGQMLYAGDFKNGKFTGYGRFYHSGRLLYDGEFIDDVYEGTGKLYEYDRLLYDGDFSGGRYNGDGTLYQNNQLLYKGQFLQGSKNGEGNLYSLETGKLKYSGSFKEDVFEGQGKWYGENGGRLRYEGSLAAGKFDGAGVLYSASGQKLYEGIFYEGNIDYMSLCKADADEIREDFGKEDTMELLDNSFLLVYNELGVAFELGYVDSEVKPTVNKIIFIGDQSVKGVSRSMTLAEYKKYLGLDSSYTEYSFIAGENEVVLSKYANFSIQPGEQLYCIKYIFDDYFIRAYSKQQNTPIFYFELGATS